MCGICGIIANNGRIDEETLKSMTRILSHRGPDNEGFHVEESAGLGHRRLSIIDLSTGEQPIYNETGSICIVFNGEIYNYRELKKDLQLRGHHFATNSDTEVIIHLFEDKGPECLRDLRGMFALAIWDQEKRELFLARDRVGKKPLYYAQLSNEFIFASELKSILLHPSISRHIDFESLHDFFAYSYIPAPKTILKGIFKLEAAHYLLWKKGTIHKKCYWRLDYQPKQNISEDRAIDRIKHLVDDAVKVRLESEVPLGCLLSGGIDSAATVAMMRRHVAGDLHTFTIGFEDEQYSEIPNAKLIARKFETKHEVFIVRPKAIEILPKLVWHFDEPFGDSSGIATYCVSNMARQKVTVVLNGDGGDESFFGYRRYCPSRENDVMSEWRKIPRTLRANIIHRLVKKLFEAEPNSYILQRFYSGNLHSLLGPQERYIDGLRLFPDHLIKVVAGPAVPINMWLEYSSSFLLDVMQTDASLPFADQMIRTDNLTYLPGDLLVKMDRMSMANSLEARSPFLDHHLMEFVASLPIEIKFNNGKLKYLIKKVLRDIIPNQILDGPKRGFTVPIKRWFRKDLNEYARDILLSRQANERGLVNQRFVRQILKRHESGQRDYHSAIWCMLNFEIWCRTFLDRSDISSGSLL